MWMTLVTCGLRHEKWRQKCAWRCQENGQLAKKSARKKERHEKESAFLTKSQGWPSPLSTLLSAITLNLALIVFCWSAMMHFISLHSASALTCFVKLGGRKKSWTCYTSWGLLKILCFVRVFPWASIAMRFILFGIQHDEKLNGFLHFFRPFSPTFPGLFTELLVVIVSWYSASN